ncbi:hypothetical protein AN958_02847 [Leucoagaricus sp. SymC.cos]|nr:hypothetical protein AN958_02847 [Leucoagaricus sp. SymC.cos]
MLQQYYVLPYKERQRKDARSALWRLSSARSSQPELQISDTGNRPGRMTRVALTLVI